MNIQHIGPVTKGFAENMEECFLKTYSYYCDLVFKGVHLKDMEKQRNVCEIMVEIFNPNSVTKKSIVSSWLSQHIDVRAIQGSVYLNEFKCSNILESWSMKLLNVLKTLDSMPDKDQNTYLRNVNAVISLQSQKYLFAKCLDPRLKELKELIMKYHIIDRAIGAHLGALYFTTVPDLYKNDA